MSQDTLTREDWLREALCLMDREGVHALRIERLSEILGVTKGSFYWHFEGYDDLLRSLLHFWAEALPNMIREDMVNKPRDPSERFLWLLERIVAEELNEHDQAVRAWAKFDPAAKAIVRKVDVERLEYVRSLFVEMGFDEAEAELRSNMSYYYVIGEQVTAVEQTPEERMAHVRARHALLTAPTH